MHAFFQAPPPPNGVFEQVPLRIATGAVAARSRIGIIGSGNSACALAAYLSERGHSISMLTRSVESRPDLYESKVVRAAGKIEGNFSISDFTSDAVDFAEHSEYIIIATVATAYGEVIARIAPQLKPHHRIILFSSKLGGCLEVQHLLNQLGKPGIPVLETDALFACRVQEDGHVWVKGVKNWTLYCSTSDSVTMEHGHILTDLFPGLEPATNFVQRGLTDFGALAHAPIMLANMNTVDRGEIFKFYRHGVTETTVRILEQLEHEFSQLSLAYGARLISMPDLLNRYYGCETDSLLSAMRTVPNYESSLSPATLEHRFLSEDVSCTLVPASELAAKAGVDVPVLNSIITLSSVLAGEDLRRSGRTLEKLGLENLDAGAIREAMSA